MEREAATCRECGTRAEDVDPERGAEGIGLVPIGTRCPGCARLQQWAKENADLLETELGIQVHLGPAPVVSA